MKLKHVIFLFMFIPLTISRTIIPQTHSTLEGYVEEGIKNNIVLQQKQVSYKKAVYSLRSATSMFFPSVTLQADYTHGDGGRSINIPVGDLLNPVYQTLNQLTGTNNFPQINNVKENLFPSHFYDVRLRTSMPIINTDIIFNRDIESTQLKIREYEVDLYRKELTKEIKTAYYNYLSLLEAVNIYHSALDLAIEGKRVNESLLKNGSGLPVYLLRSDSEIESVNALLNEAKSKSDNAKRYFNFLLNRDLDSSVTLMTVSEPVEPVDDAEVITRQREEIRMLDGAIQISESLLKMNQYYWIPKVSGFIDYGAQNSDWNYNKQSRYYLYGLQMEIPIFEGFRNRNKIQIARYDLKHAVYEYEKTKKTIDLSLSISKSELQNAISTYQSSQKNMKASQDYYRLITKGYREGANSFIETVDARNQLTSSQLSVNINKYKALIAQAAYEREISSLPLNQE